MDTHKHKKRKSYPKKKVEKGSVQDVCLKQSGRSTIFPVRKPMHYKYILVIKPTVTLY